VVPNREGDPKAVLFVLVPPNLNFEPEENALLGADEAPNAFVLDPPKMEPVEVAPKVDVPNAGVLGLLPNPKCL